MALHLHGAVYYNYLHRKFVLRKLYKYPVLQITYI